MFRKRNRKMQCGFCTLLSNLLRSLMCIGSRRGSTESYYRELGEQDTLKIDDRSSACSEESEILSLQPTTLCIQREYHAELANITLRGVVTGRFLTLHRRCRRRQVTRSLVKDMALLDDLLLGQVQCILNQSVLWRFNAFTLENVSGGRCLPVLCVHLFHMYGLIKHFKLDAERVWKLFSLIEEGYHGTNPYHNSVHAVDVTQAMHCFLQQQRIREHMEPLEVLASLLAAIAHDLDHPGVNQPFLIATSNHLAGLYHNSSVLENHHWRSAVSCMLESRMLAHVLVDDTRQKLVSQISSLILATDISRQQEYLNRFREVANEHVVHLMLSGYCDPWTSETTSNRNIVLFKSHLDNETLDMTLREHRHLVLQIALKCADISNPCRPWEVSRKWSLKVCEEFFRQGDYERKLNLPITALCDRYTTSIPRIQTGFFKFVVSPLMSQWHRFLQNNLTKQMMRNLLYNQNKWETLMAEELADEAKNKIATIEVVEESDEDEIGSMSDSAERLLPLRRRSLTKKRSSLKREIRRFSVPLNLFQDSCFKLKDVSASSNIDIPLNQAVSEQPVHTVNVHCDPAQSSETDNVLSTENLLPDTSIASITTPAQASRLHSLKEGGPLKLVRQQTFPPLEAANRALPLSRSLYNSEEEEMFRIEPKTLSQIIVEANAIDAKVNNMLKATGKETCGETSEEGDNMKVVWSNSSCTGRRESAPICFQLRESCEDQDSVKMIWNISNSIGRRDSAPIVPQREGNEQQDNLKMSWNTSTGRHQLLPIDSQLNSEERDSVKIIWNNSNSIGRRESAPTGYQLRDNLTSIQLSGIASDPILRRRKSMPTDVMCASKLRELTAALPEMLRRTLSTKETWARRRGSAPVPLVASDLAQGLRRTGSRRKQTVATCQQWFSKTTYSVQEAYPIHRRSSLPVEVMTGISSH